MRLFPISRWSAAGLICALGLFASAGCLSESSTPPKTPGAAHKAPNPASSTTGPGVEVPDAAPEMQGPPPKTKEPVATEADEAKPDDAADKKPADEAKPEADKAPETKE